MVRPRAAHPVERHPDLAVRQRALVRQLAKVIEGVPFNDGIEVVTDSRAAARATRQTPDLTIARRQAVSDQQIRSHHRNTVRRVNLQRLQRRNAARMDAVEFDEVRRRT